VWQRPQQLRNDDTDDDTDDRVGWLISGDDHHCAASGDVR
jgi:hypothetical protein